MRMMVFVYFMVGIGLACSSLLQRRQAKLKISWWEFFFYILTGGAMIVLFLVASVFDKLGWMSNHNDNSSS